MSRLQQLRQELARLERDYDSLLVEHEREEKAHQRQCAEELEQLYKEHQRQQPEEKLAHENLIESIKKSFEESQRNQKGVADRDEKDAKEEIKRLSQKVYQLKSELNKQEQELEELKFDEIAEMEEDEAAKKKEFAEIRGKFEADLRKLEHSHFQVSGEGEKKNQEFREVHEAGKAQQVFNHHISTTEMQIRSLADVINDVDLQTTVYNASFNSRSAEKEANARRLLASITHARNYSENLRQTISNFRESCQSKKTVFPAICHNYQKALSSMRISLIELNDSMMEAEKNLKIGKQLEEKGIRRKLIDFEKNAEKLHFDDDEAYYTCGSTTPVTSRTSRKSSNASDSSFQHMKDIRY